MCFTIYYLPVSFDMSALQNLKCCFLLQILIFSPGIIRNTTFQQLLFSPKTSGRMKSAFNTKSSLLVTLNVQNNLPTPQLN